MTKAPAQNDVPLPLAALALLAVASAYLYLNYFRFEPAKLEALRIFAESNSSLLWVSFCAFMVNLAFVSIFLRRTLGLDRQGSKLEVLQGKRKRISFGKADIIAAACGTVAYLVSATVLTAKATHSLSYVIPIALAGRLSVALSLNLAVLSYLVSRILLGILGHISFSLGGAHKLDEPEAESGDLVLGTTSGELSHSATETPEEWVKIPGRGVNGGIFISGSIGSGKTQGTILRYLRQLLAEAKGAPAILAIDPKGTFLKEAERLIERAGLRDRIVKISLRGNVSFNPVYMENPLQDSKFAGLAEMVRAAAVNFMGKSSDSPFWDVSSSHLIRNTIAYCAAQHGYFTLLDLYRAIVRASKHNLADDLRARLKEGKFNEEETFNITCAIEYFENEYSQLEDRVRTGIVATSTAFVNQFQEFAANRVFCPSEEHVSITSMEDFVRDGKILLFDIQQPGLARSMGTFIKLHFEQAVLNLVSELKEKDMPFTTALIIDEYQDCRDLWRWAVRLVTIRLWRKHGKLSLPSSSQLNHSAV